MSFSCLGSSEQPSTSIVGPMCLFLFRGLQGNIMPPLHVIRDIFSCPWSPRKSSASTCSQKCLFLVYYLQDYHLPLHMVRDVFLLSAICKETVNFYICIFLVHDLQSNPVPLHIVRGVFLLSMILRAVFYLYMYSETDTSLPCASVLGRIKLSVIISSLQIRRHFCFAPSVHYLTAVWWRGLK